MTGFCEYEDGVMGRGPLPHLHIHKNLSNVKDPRTDFLFLSFNTDWTLFFSHTSACYLTSQFVGALIIIEFPDRERAHTWYTSEAYQRILPFRLAHAKGEVILIDTVPGDHKATDVIKP